MIFEYQTNRLILRILGPDAAPSVLNFYLNDRELFEQFEGERVPQFYTVKFQRETLHQEYNLTCRGLHVRFYVFLKEDPHTIIGTVCFHNIQSYMYSCCELGYKFSSAFHHHGYALEAVEKGIDLIFTDFHLHRIMAWVLPDNIPAQRLLTSLGFEFEGINRDRLFMHNRWYDHAQYSLISPLPKSGTASHTNSLTGAYRSRPQTQ
jgi:ribosomal-protein-alanine N-acetyltransferase